MLEEPDQDYINFFSKIRYPSASRGKKRKLKAENEEIEIEYEANKTNKKVKVKNLLPIKIKDRLIPQSVIDDTDNANEDEDTVMEGETFDDETELNAHFDVETPLTTAQLLARRNKTLQLKKIHVGTLCSGLLENPEEKLTNFRTLLKLMDDTTPELYFTLKKIVIAALLEVFKDLLPSYQIKGAEDTGIRLKKETLKLHKYEEGILLYYKKYLQKLQKCSSILISKLGDSRKKLEEEIKLAELAVHAMCDLLITHPYFNYAENIAEVIVPFLNNKIKSVRMVVKDACKTVFKEDKKQLITLKILRVVNQYLKTHSHNVNPEMLEILLHLKIKDVNLDQEKEHNLKEKKLMSHKQNVFQLSKKERKRKKKLELLEKELLETRAEESKQNKQQNLTEIAKIVFGIYFRILKSSSNTKVLGICLEGLSKYSHCINIDFYVDLVNILDKLLREDWLGYREKLHCILTVFSILGGVGEALNMDPTRFYVALYKDLLTTHAAKNHGNFDIVLQTLSEALIKRRKKITNKRIIGYVKKVGTLSLQLLHNSTLSCLAMIKIMLQLNKAVDTLLDLDVSVGDGKYEPELEDAEYSNASSTALFEVVPLTRHYHPIVAKYARHIANGVPATGNGSLPAQFGKCTPEQLFQDYDMSQLVFNPSVAPPKKAQPKAKIRNAHFIDDTFKSYCYDTLSKQCITSVFI